MTMPTNTPTPALVRPCPHCQAPRDLTTRLSGDTVYCPSCSGWFRVVFLGSVYDVSLTPCDAPVSWPRATRRRG